MSATVEDVAATRLLLGLGLPNQRMNGLTGLMDGVATCVHPMAGDGQHLFGASAPIFSNNVHDTYRKAPYYHHAFTLDPRPTATAPRTYCYCGNLKGGEVHDRCDIDIDMRKMVRALLVTP